LFSSSENKKISIVHGCHYGTSGGAEVFKVVICDDIDDAFRKSGELSRLNSLAQVVIHSEIAPNPGGLVQRLSDATVAVAIRDRTVLDRETLSALPKLRLIAYTGPHRIDIATATELGIAVAQAPGTSTPSVAEHVFGLILALARRIPHLDSSVRQGQWEYSAGVELERKVLGIVGLGRTGTAVAKRAPAFGLQVIAWGPTLTPERAMASGAEMVNEEKLFRASDILSLHLRRSDFSRGYINAKRLSWMKPSAFLVDISWEGIVDRVAVAEALRNGALAGAALDLCGTDPVKGDDPLFGAPNTVLTPHIAWQTKESYKRSAALVVDNILAYLQARPTNLVNPAILSSRRQTNPL
jgi:phosphoglycerate dehydrogenase-like enzyme